jgi:cysteine synthase
VLRRDTLDCIGRTPLVRLRAGGGEDVEVYAKLELMNPFGMKDRAARHMILEAKRKGVLADDGVIVESSSGTMALAVGLAGRLLGHEVHIVTDPRIDSITLAKLAALRCHVHVVERMTEQGWQGARLERLEEVMAEHPGAFWPRQYDNPDNPAAYEALAEEVLEDLGWVDAIVASVGSGGSLCGAARVLRGLNPDLRVIAVDAVGSRIFDQPDRPTRLQSGLGNSLVPPNVDHALIDEVHWLSDEEAFAATLELVAEEGIFAGSSSGSCYAVARWLARESPAGTTIVTILPDRGDRYAGTIYSESYRREHGIERLRLPPEPQSVPYGEPVTSWSCAAVERSAVEPALVR